MSDSIYHMSYKVVAQAKVHLDYFHFLAIAT